MPENSCRGPGQGAPQGGQEESFKKESFKKEGFQKKIRKEESRKEKDFRKKGGKEKSGQEESVKQEGQQEKDGQKENLGLSRFRLFARGGHFCTERSEEHTSELQSRGHLVCRLLLENKTVLGCQ